LTWGGWEWEDYSIYRHGGGEGAVEGYWLFQGRGPLHRAGSLVEAQVVAERNAVALIHARRHEIAVEDETLRLKLSMLKNRTCA
jgi:hypothetical protein